MFENTSFFWIVWLSIHHFHFSIRDSVASLIAKEVEWDLSTNKAWWLKSWMWPKKQHNAVLLHFIFFYSSKLFTLASSASLKVFSKWKCFLELCAVAPLVLWEDLQNHRKETKDNYILTHNVTKNTIISWWLVAIASPKSNAHQFKAKMGPNLRRKNACIINWTELMILITVRLNFS